MQDAPVPKIAIALIVVALAGIAFFKFGGNVRDAAPLEKLPLPNRATTTAVGGGGQLNPEGFSRSVDKDSVLESNDAGRTFRAQFRIEATSTVGQADVLSIAFHPLARGTVLVSSVADGIFKKTSSSLTWTQISFPPKQIYSFILDRDEPDRRMFASGVVSDFGRVFRTDDGGRNWIPVYSEPGPKTTITSLAQHPKDPDIILAGTSGGTVVKSTDGGDTWRNVGNVIAGTIRDISFDSAKSSSYYVLSFRQKAFYSPDGGLTWIDWEAKKQEEVQDMQKRAMSLSSQGDYKGAEAVQKAAQTLAERNQKDRMPQNIVSVRADPNISGTVYVGTEGGLFRSPDYGKYWYGVNIIESAAQFPIRSIAINVEDSNEIVFVAGRSFYRSLNRGETWSITPLGNNRDASFVVFDPFDRKHVFVGVSSVW